MKKYLSLLMIVFAVCFATAQEPTPEEIATAKSTELQQQFNLDENQKSALYRAFYAKELNYRKHVIGHENDEYYARNKEKIDASFDHVLKKTLGEENYNTYKENN